MEKGTEVLIHPQKRSINSLDLDNKNQLHSRAVMKA
jgi:hypothetical protein